MLYFKSFFRSRNFQTGLCCLSLFIAFIFTTTNASNIQQNDNSRKNQSKDIEKTKLSLRKKIRSKPPVAPLVIHQPIKKFIYRETDKPTSKIKNE